MTSRRMQTPKDDWELEHVKACAKLIVSNKQLKDVLKAARPNLRRDCYEQLKVLVDFKVQPYWWMRL